MSLWFTALLLTLGLAIGLGVMDIPHIFGLPVWVKITASIAVTALWIVMMASFWIKPGPKNQEADKEAGPRQSASTTGPGSPMFQAGRDLTIVQQSGPVIQNTPLRLQSGQLAERLMRFRGIFVRVENQNGSETSDLAEEIRASLRIAGLEVPSDNVIIDESKFSFRGIKIFVQEHELSPGDLAPSAAEALVDELGRQNFQVNRFAPVDRIGTANFIRIRIGMRQ
jgi:hypothetical protein